MKVNAAMTPDVRLISPDQSICDAAKLMGEIDAGVLPVVENHRLVGMITDRDVAVRAVGQGRSPDTKVGDVMTREILYCLDDDDLEDVARSMSTNQIRRLPVIDHAKRLVGILSLGDLARHHDPERVGRALYRVATPSHRHSQSAY
jgi:CBS domain-containing protein